MAIAIFVAAISMNIVDGVHFRKEVFNFKRSVSLEASVLTVDNFDQDYSSGLSVISPCSIE